MRISTAMLCLALGGCSSFGPGKCSIGDTITPDFLSYGAGIRDDRGAHSHGQSMSLSWYIPQPSEIAKNCRSAQPKSSESEESDNVKTSNGGDSLR